MKNRTLTLTIPEAKRLLELIDRGMAYTDEHLDSYGRRDAGINDKFQNDIINRLGAHRQFCSNGYYFG